MPPIRNSISFSLRKEAPLPPKPIIVAGEGRRGAQCGEKNDCKAYKWNKETKTNEIVQLDPEKQYKVFFINKTRSDGGGKEILMEWRSEWNAWFEVGYCHIVNNHRGMG